MIEIHLISQVQLREFVKDHLDKVKKTFTNALVVMYLRNCRHVPRQACQAWTPRIVDVSRGLARHKMTSLM